MVFLGLSQPLVAVAILGVRWLTDASLVPLPLSSRGFFCLCVQISLLLQVYEALDQGPFQSSLTPF